MKRTWVPQGIAFCELNVVTTTEHFVFVLLPNLSMMAFSAAVEPLRIANQITGRELFHWTCVSEDGHSVRCSNGVPIGVDGTLDDIDPTAIVLVCSGVLPEQSTSKKVADKVRRLWRQGQTVGGICTGTYTLAKAGILQGTSATLHWENIPAFCELYPHLTVTERVFDRSNRIWTCAGGIASTDMMVSHIMQLYGKDVAGTVANMSLHHMPRSESQPQRAGVAATVGMRHTKLVHVIEYLENHLEDECHLDEVAGNFDISRRQLERLFKRYLETTPKKYLTQIRLHRARSLMSETGLSVSEVAAACGFGSASHFSKRFKETFGVSPHQYSLIE